jgi:hypothetical protein
MLAFSHCRLAHSWPISQIQIGNGAYSGSRKPTGIRVEAGTCGIPQAIKAVLRRPDGTLADTCASTSGGPATSPEAIAPPANDNLCGLHGTLIHPIEPWKRDHVAGRQARPCSTMQPSGRVGLNVEGRRE